MTTEGERAAQEQVAARTSVYLRPLAGPLSIGFFGLAAATFVVAGLNLGWVKATEGKTVALCLIAFTVPLQFTASIIGFLGRDGSYAAEYEDVLKRSVLPLGRRGRGRIATQGTYAEQIAEVHHEAGVRNQL